MHSFGIKRTTCWWLDNNAANGLISPLHLPARSRAPPIHTPLSEWAIIAPLISICCVLLMRGRPIDTLQKRGKKREKRGGRQQHYNRKEIYFLIIM